MEFTLMEKKLKQELSAKRFDHSVGVWHTAVELSERFGADVHKAAVAGLLHDCAREMSNNNLLKITGDFDIVVGSIEKICPVLLHAAVSAHIAAVEYGVRDEEIHKAIMLHTTGSANMSKLAKIIFLADFIEPGRAYPGIDKLRKLAREDLDKAVLAAFDHTISYLLKEKMVIHPASIDGRNELLISLSEKEL